MKTEKTNKLLEKFVLGGAVINGLSTIASKVSGEVSSTIKKKCLYMIDISSIVSRVSDALGRHFGNRGLPDNATAIGTKVFITNRVSWETYQTSTANSYFAIINGYPVVLDMTPERDRDGCLRLMKISLITINTPSAKQNLRMFVAQLIKENDMIVAKKAADTVHYKVEQQHGSFWNEDKEFIKRTFNDTFIPADQERLIKDSLDHFVASRDWYKKNRIPYHFGFLLYGAAGTGKTSVSQAIADYLGAELYVLSGDSLGELKQSLNTYISKNAIDKNVYRVICIEDIDCGFSKSSTDIATEMFMNRITDSVEDRLRGGHSSSGNNRTTGLADILNCFDGIHAPENAIYVLTTNHIDKLDPALIRPGRIDIKIEIPTVTAETLTRFIETHYDVATPHVEDEWLRKDVTFAELQTSVMKRFTPEQIIEQCMRKDDDNEAVTR